MNLIYSIPIYKSSKLSQLSRINNLIYGFDQYQQSYCQIDTKHSTVYNYQLPSNTHGPLLNCKYIENYIPNIQSSYNKNSGYINVYEKSIQTLNFMQFHNMDLSLAHDNIKKKSNCVLTSNNLADFTGIFDAYYTELIFTKHHLNHNKFTINWLQSSSSQKKILKLLDCPVLFLKLVHNYPQIIYSDQQFHSKLFSIQKPSLQTIISTKSTILFDNHILYNTTTDILSKCNNKYNIQAIDIKTGKNVFTFQGQYSPIKIQTYGEKVFYLSNKGLYVYDKRKIEPICYVEIDGNNNGKKNNNKEMSDFLLEPNLKKIYISMTNQFRVYQFQFN